MKFKIYIGANSDLPNVKKSLQTILTRLYSLDIPKDDIQIIEAAASDFEYPALRRLWLDSFSEEFYGLYLHCKGASKTDTKELENGLAWLNYMLYGLVDNYKTCVDHLSKGADLVGAIWYRHFKGNCFWFKSSYVKKLGDPYNLDVSNRYHAEYWCAGAYWHNSNICVPKVKNLFYLPLRTDDDFLTLQQDGYSPDLNIRNTCKNLRNVIDSSDYSVYDNLEISNEDYKELEHLVEKYTNYDSTITII